MFFFSLLDGSIDHVSEILTDKRENETTTTKNKSSIDHGRTIIFTSFETKDQLFIEMTTKCREKLS